MEATATSKVCPRCNQDKPLDDFVRSSRSKDGHAGYCRSCQHDVYVERKHQRSCRIEGRAIQEKLCPRCKRTKSVLDFGKDKNQVDGFARACKPCTTRLREIYRERMAARERGEKLPLLCADCLQERDSSEFDPVELKKMGLRAICKACHRIRKREYLRNIHHYRISRTYGLSPSQYADLLSDHSGRCAICGGVPDDSENPLVVDHDHRTGKVRGLLCHHHNVALGMIREDAGILKAMIEYLQKHGGA